MSTAHELYFVEAARALPRLLSLLDRNPFSPTFGCFDRSYWLHRKTDFPSSSAQISVKTLVLYYKENFPGNSLYGQDTARAWVEGAIRYTISLQHKDGSFDEWYPNERGWAGPTGYVAHALVEARDLMFEDLPGALWEEVDESLRRAALHLSKRGEGDILANHYAIALLPLTEIAILLGSRELTERSREWREKFFSLANSEGWSLEYDGCDIGYNLGTLDFLADLHKKTGDSKITEYAEKAFSFLSYFAYPDGSWAGSLGSRHTAHSYPYALEYWAAQLPEARPLWAHARRAMMAGITISAYDQEDHYLHYRLADYVKAAKIALPGPAQERLPYESPDFRLKIFPAAGFRIERMGRFMVWVALHRGGAFRVYGGPRLLAANNGCVVETEGGRMLTSLWQGSRAKDSDGISVRGHLHPLFQKRFSPFSFLFFRISCLMAISPLTAYALKKVVRSLMITRRAKSGSIWERNIQQRDEELWLEDRIRLDGADDWKRIYWGGEFTSRYVPQSHYFQKFHSCHMPVIFEKGAGLGRSLKITWRIGLAGATQGMEADLGPADAEISSFA